MKKIIDIPIHFVRRALYFLTKALFSLICVIIYLITFEPFKRGIVTLRKIRRIKVLTKFKLWLWRNFRWYIEFIHDDKYFIDLEKRLGNGLQL